MIRFEKPNLMGKPARDRIKAHLIATGTTQAIVTQEVNRTCECGGRFEPDYFFAVMQDNGYSPWEYTCNRCHKQMKFQAYGFTNLPKHYIVGRTA